MGVGDYKMKEELGKLKCEGRLEVDKLNPAELADLYLDEEDWKILVNLLGTNRVTVVLRMKGIG